MKSIRQRLTLTLLLGFTVLFGAGASVKYWYFHQMLSERFDAELRARAVIIASSVKADHSRLEVHFSEYVARGISAVDEIGFYEIWRINGRSLGHSAGLKPGELPSEFSYSNAPVFFNARLADGEPIRGVGFKFAPDPERDAEGDHEDNEPVVERKREPTVGLVVASRRAPLNAALNHLMAIATVTSVLSLLLAVVLVRFTLYRGLRPLDQLAEQTRQLDVHTLKTRLPADGVPEELTPIYGRLNDLLARLDGAFTEMSEYAGKVTHELRTPLTILRLKLEQAGTDVAPELAEELQAELHHLTHVIDQSLLIARAEQGRIPIQTKTFDLAALVADVAEDFSLIAEDVGRQVYQSGVDTPALVQADPNHTRQIIHNLLTNAWKHGEGLITVRVKPLGRDKISVLIFNPVPRQAATSGTTLGLGLRVVGTLLALQPGLRCQRRSRPATHATRLVFPGAADSRR